MAKFIFIATALFLSTSVYSQAIETPVVTTPIPIIEMFSSMHHPIIRAVAAVPQHEGKAAKAAPLIKNAILGAPAPKAIKKKPDGVAAKIFTPKRTSKRRME